jgi:FMN phosphatase YigB (HAD superfamily)
MTFDDIHIIGFDLDQTLYPKSPLIDEAIQGYLYAKIAERLHIERGDAASRFEALYANGQGMSGSASLVQLGFSRDEASSVVQEALERADIDAFLVPNAETIAFLQRCADRFDAVDLITGSAREIAKRKLEKLQIPIEIFGECITGDDASKSDGAAYQRWLGMYPDRLSSEFLYVGDRPSSDYEAPKLLGIQSVLVNVVNAKADCPQYPSIADLNTAMFGGRK